MNEIEKKDDAYSRKSSEALQELVGQSIKKVFVGCLNAIEMKFGKNFDGYDILRANVLRLGNDSIREIQDKIGEDFNVEMIPDILTIHFKNGRK